MGLYLWIGVFVVSVFALIKAADYFTESAEKIGYAFRIPSFIVGGTIVAFGTSLPELVSSVFAVLRDSSEIVIGNVIGSNITNICLILGVAAIVAGKRLKVTRELIDVDLPLLIGSAFALAITIWDGLVTQTEAVLMLLGLLLFILYTLYGERHGDIEVSEEIAKSTQQGKIGAQTIVTLVVSGILIYFGAKYTIDSVIELSSILNIGTEIIALFAVALGTSLPELAVSIRAAQKGRGEIAVGNVIGSNIFNVFAVVGIPALIGTLTISSAMVSLYLPLMIMVSLLYFFIAQDKSFTRWEGYLLLLFYLFFIGTLFS